MPAAFAMAMTSASVVTMRPMSSRHDGYFALSTGCRAAVVDGK